MVGYHEPVLLKEVLQALEVKSGDWYVDATLGDGGHSMQILKRGGNVVGIDVDPKALVRARERFEKETIEADRFRLILGNFRDLNNLILQSHFVLQRRTSRDKQAEPKRFKGVLFDLGVSSLQLEDPDRGFSFGKAGSLDMRMDPSLIVSAADLIKVLRKDQLNELFSRLGEEKYSRAMASAVDNARKVAGNREQVFDSEVAQTRGGTGISTTVQLAKVLEKAVGGRRDKIHPATRVFQALRIAVNDELNALQEALPLSLELLGGGGRVVVISFHSLEDRIVKNTFKQWEKSGLGKMITKKPIAPTEDEARSNPRSRSAKLRVFKKT